MFGCSLCCVKDCGLKCSSYVYFSGEVYYKVDKEIVFLVDKWVFDVMILLGLCEFGWECCK